MKRTHVTHTRDNRRAFHFANHERKNDGPSIEWRRTEDGEQQQLWIDHQLFGTIDPVGDPEFIWDAWGRSVRVQQYKAETARGESGIFPDADAARLFLERMAK